MRRFFSNDNINASTGVNEIWTAQTTLIGKKYGMYQALISFTWFFNYEDYQVYKMQAYQKLPK